jgi:hypothetical protein
MKAPIGTNTTMVTDYLGEGADDTLFPLDSANAEAEAAAAAMMSPLSRRESKSKRSLSLHMDMEQRWLYPLVLSEKALARVARTPRRSLSLSSSAASVPAIASASSPPHTSPSGPISVSVGRGMHCRDRGECRGLDTSGGGRHDSGDDDEQEEEAEGRAGPRYSPAHSSKLVMDV